MRISYAGENAFLLDASSTVFEAGIQACVINAAHALARHTGVMQAIPGVNNLLMVFDSVMHDHHEARIWLEDAWYQASSDEPDGRMISIPVTYDSESSEDLKAIAHYCNLTMTDVISLHSNTSYRVAAVGAMPGFVYLSGLDPRLAIPRRQVPRMLVEKGSVIIGGGNAGVMPCTAPSGWYQLGHTDIALFDHNRNPPCYLEIGDRVRFVNAR